jgi:hypothetical protein
MVLRELIGEFNFVFPASIKPLDDLQPLKQINRPVNARSVNCPDPLY